MIDLVAATPAGAPLRGLDNGQVAAALASGVPVFDIRRPYEWEGTGIIPGSRLLTFFDETGGFDLEGWMAAFTAVVGRDDVFVLVCRLGRRTDVLGRYLGGACGYAGAAHLEHGITWWAAAGYPLVAPPTGV
ncbi:MAG TPA: rhodanese-like domain-containing protein [Candidatus Krumholzibacteria bacterium]|nr:rhodanese-like domain-containing protein [Candidatus Krumholzibacteria bacterium]